jgi:phosphoenolpyruvate-protein phosphotransferase
VSAVLSGRGAAPGAAIAPAAVVAVSVVATEDTPAGTPDEERARLDDALTRAAHQLEALAAKVTEEVGEDEGEIFEAHAEFASDPELASRAHAAIADGAPATEAIRAAFDAFRELLEASGSEYLAARATDLDDVRDRVIALLTGAATEVEVPEVASVIVAHELTPSQTASIPRELIAAIVTATGSPTSHAAILARALGVPAVVGVDGLLDAVTAGTVLAVDGVTGDVVVDPDADAVAAAEKQRDQAAARRSELSALRDVAGATADGRRVELAANLGGRDDLEVAVEAGAEGSGLVRTEFLYLDRTSAPSVAEQQAFLEDVLRTFPGHRVVVRTLDVGADKPLPFVPREDEPNPALGLRGIRMSLARPQLFRDQLRALLRARAAVGDDGARLAIMFPLVCVPGELDAARVHLTEVAAEVGHDLTGLEVGVMVETPAAALAADRLADRADFLSVGTNDLLQYAFAADRLVGGVADLPRLEEPGLLRLLGEVVAAAHARDAWVGVCGEAASDPALALALVGLGVDELSMTRVAIPEVKSTLAAVTSDDCARLAAAAVGAADADAARALLDAAVPG